MVILVKLSLDKGHYISACKYILKKRGIDLSKINQEDGRHEYYYSCHAKDGLFKMEYGSRNGGSFPFHELGNIEVDMLSRSVKEV